MNAFLSSVKDDLLDVRLRLAVLLLGAALVAAVAYAVLGGGSSSATAPASRTLVSTGVTGISISQAPASTLEPVTETTNGVARQRGGSLHDPFAPLAGAAATSSASKASTPSTAGSSTSSSAALGGSSTSGAGSTTPAATPKPTTPAKPKVTIHYKVTAQFGVLPAPSIEGGPPAAAQLKTYPNMRLDEPLPNKSNTQLVYVGVVLRTGTEAEFALTGESILHGGATCVPSATQCQAIRLRAGQSETLESVEPNGGPVTYELKLVSIVRVESTASAGRARAAFVAGESKVGRELLQRKGLTAVSGLKYSPSKGVLVYVGRRASAARARVAAERRRHER